MRKRWTAFFYTGMVMLTVLAGLKGIWISLDVDESYTVAQSYRLAAGDRMIVDMWEPHQFSAFLGALFIKPYLFLAGTTDYLVVYLRVAGTLLHTVLGLALFGMLRKSCGRALSFLILLLHLNFMPKWLMTTEFEIMHYWFLLAVFLLLWRYFALDAKKGRPFAVCAGVCLVGSMLCYPTMILLYPVYFAGICVLEKQLHRREGRGVIAGGILFTLGALASGLAFLGYLFSYMSLEEFLKNLTYIFMDESHNIYTSTDRWVNYAAELTGMGREYLKCLLIGAGIFAVGLLAGWTLRRMRSGWPGAHSGADVRESGDRGKVCVRDEKSGAGEPRPVRKTQIGYYIEAVLMAVFLLAVLIMEIAQICGCLLQDENQFYMQSRYMAVFLPALYLGIRYHRRMAKWFWLCVLPGLLSVPAVVLVSNMNINTSLSKAFIGVLGSFLIFYEYGKLLAQKDGLRRNVMSFLQYAAMLGMLAGFFVCRLILIRVTGCLPVTVRAPLEKLEAGPAKGIYVLEETARVWNDNYADLEKYVGKEDRLLYVGAENLIYVAAESIFATPSTQGTTVFNEMYLYYFEEHPEKLPDVIIIDKTFASNPVYAYSPQNEVIFTWVGENYGDAEVTETEYLTILRE